MERCVGLPAVRSGNVGSLIDAIALERLGYVNSVYRRHNQDEGQVRSLGDLLYETLAVGFAKEISSVVVEACGAKVRAH